MSYIQNELKNRLIGFPKHLYHSFPIWLHTFLPILPIIVAHPSSVSTFPVVPLSISTLRTTTLLKTTKTGGNNVLNSLMLNARRVLPPTRPHKHDTITLTKVHHIHFYMVFPSSSLRPLPNQGKIDRIHICPSSCPLHYSLELFPGRSYVLKTTTLLTHSQLCSNETQFSHFLNVKTAVSSPLYSKLQIWRVYVKLCAILLALYTSITFHNLLYFLCCPCVLLKR